MAIVQQYQLSNGGIVDIEVEDSATKKGPGPAGAGIRDKLKKSSETLQDALAGDPGTG